jgi:hypothetical protein
VRPARVVLLVGLCGVALAMPAYAAAVTTSHAPLVIPCGSSGTAVPAGWFFPDRRRPTGIVWVQHGFFRAARNVLTLARYIAEHTGAIVVAPTLSSNPFADAGCWINGPPMAESVAGLFAASRAALQHSADVAAGHHVALPRRFVLTGHSAGGNLVTSAAGDTTLPGGAIHDLRGVVLYDAVDFAGAMPAALRRLTGAALRPVLQIASPPSACNAGGSGSNALLTARPGTFVGVQLVGGTHIDAEGPDTDPLAVLACGVPTAANVAAVRSLAANWIRNALRGSARRILGGTPGERIKVGGATAVVLPTQ